MELSEIVGRYGTPDPAIVGQRDNGKGQMLSYVGHGDVTKMLIEIDPLWSWEPVAWIEGRPAIHRHHAKFVYRNGDVKETEIATMWGFMTLLGKSLPCVGSAPADKEDVEKELIGDLIRNGALRFGICINLWANKSEQTSPARQYETRQQATPRAATTAGGTLRVKGSQWGELPQWAIDAAAEQGIVEVYDNRDVATIENKRPWFKCTASKVGLWPPRGTGNPVLSAPEPADAQFPDDEEIPF